MAKPTATGKPTLVIIETQSGPQPQIWYRDGAGFVGCGHLKPIESFDLPPVINGIPWNIDAALGHITQEENHAA